MQKITESDSLHNDLELMSTHKILSGINQEDKKVSEAIELIIPDIEKFIDATYLKKVTWN